MLKDDGTGCSASCLWSTGANWGQQQGIGSGAVRRSEIRAPHLPLGAPSECEFDAPNLRLDLVYLIVELIVREFGNEVVGHRLAC